MNIEASVLSFLDTLKDPFLNLTAKEMNLKATLDITPSTLTLHLLAGFPTKLLLNTYKPLLLSTLQTTFPQYEIHIHLEHFIRAHKTQLPGKGLRHIKNTIAVASGKGGVGKSTVTVNLATALARLGAKVGILDADIYGPSIPLMLGNTEPIQIKDDHYVPVLAHGIQAMSIGYLTGQDQALIWRGPMLAKTLIQMIDRTAWDELDYLLIDLPPGTGDIQLTLVQKIPLTGAIVVTTPQTVATLDAQKAIDMFSKTNVDVLGLIENMSMHHCSQCGHEEPIFGSGGAEQLCQTHQCVLLGQLPLDQTIRRHCDQGSPVSLQSDNDLTDTLIKTALRSVIELSKRPINYADKFPKIVVES